MIDVVALLNEDKYTWKSNSLILVFSHSHIGTHISFNTNICCVVGYLLAFGRTTII